MIWATVKIMSPVLESCRISPLTQVLIPRQLRIADFVRGNQIWPDREEVVQRLAEQPLAGAGLQIAHADVVRGDIPET